ncbi:3-methyl-2-oxobutanoate hydroxymethyltransferase [Paenibacillus protaetiae]|nr:3-methyl-2-oxobutanoate hydroxymethyltransferase [Paenibacillus protaetiae]
MRKRLTIAGLKKMKQEHKRISMLTAYDYPSAKLAEEAGIDLILVGDSLGNVVLGYDTTIPVTLEDMIYHTRAVARAAKDTFIVTDMPFMTYGIGRETTLRNAARLMQEGGAQALKLEGGKDIAAEVSALVRAGIPVMGHIGLTPQSVHQLSGYKIQKEAQKLIEDAKALEEAGAFAVVVELVTEPISAAITKELSIPVIGIGAGRECDGQVLVFHDILKYSSPYYDKKFVKTYADIGTTIRDAISSYVSDVKNETFPAEENVFGAVTSGTDTVGSLYGGSVSAADAADQSGTKKEEAATRDFVQNHS